MFPKTECGLDVVNLDNWNKVVVLRRFRYLSVKSGSLVLVWVNKF